MAENIDSLISKQAVIEIVENNHAHDITLCGDAYSKGYRDGIKVKQSDILEDLAELPTVEPQIIRCKDCDYYIVHRKRGVVPVCGLIRGTPIRHDDDFCSRAERREVTE